MILLKSLEVERPSAFPRRYSTVIWSDDKTESPISLCIALQSSPANQPTKHKPSQVSLSTYLSILLALRQHLYSDANIYHGLKPFHIDMIRPTRLGASAG